MQRVKKAKSPSPERDDQAKATYFLAKKSGLFRPGTPTILANILPTKKGKRK